MIYPRMEKHSTTNVEAFLILLCYYRLNVYKYSKLNITTKDHS
jgi:hypothetical protein